MNALIFLHKMRYGHSSDTNISERMHRGGRHRYVDY